MPVMLSAATHLHCLRGRFAALSMTGPKDFSASRQYVRLRPVSFRGETHLLPAVRIRLNAFLLLFLLLLPALIFAQTTSGSLRGQVLDPTRAAIPGIPVSVVGPTGAKLVVQTDRKASMSFATWRPAPIHSRFA